MHLHLLLGLGSITRQGQLLFLPYLRDATLQLYLKLAPVVVEDVR